MARKMAYGSGSIRKRADGRWEGRYVAPGGKQKSVYGKSKAEVADALKRKQAEMLLGAYTEPSTMTLEQWVAQWLEICARTLKPASRVIYAANMRLHILPALGGMRLSKITPAHVSYMLAALPLKASSVRTAYICLHSAMSCAVRYKMIPTNPCDGATLPAKESAEITIIDGKKIAEFVAACKKNRYGNALLLLLYTGMRSSEPRGLKWEDVDMSAGTIFIHRQIVPVGGGYGYVAQTTKTGKSRRVTLVPAAIEVLRQLRREQAEARMAAGGWEDTELTADLVLRSSSGFLLSQTTLSYAIKTVGREIGMPDLTPHVLRHSYAVAALRAGVDVKSIQNALGHASAAMTLDRYAAYTDDMGRASVGKLEMVFPLESAGIGSK